MGQIIVSGAGRAKKPVTGLPISTIAEGSIVKIIENGTPVEFYVAKHNYEESLNGTGRTLLVRKDCYDTRKWHSSNTSEYAASDIDSWLNETYETVLDQAVRDAIGTTTFYYTVSKDNPVVTTLSRSVFLLSMCELGFASASGYRNDEGSALPISSVLQIAYYNGSTVGQWTRTPYLEIAGSAYAVKNDGTSTAPASGGIAYGSRPAFTIPSNSVFDDNAVFMGVS